jgi:glycosyltransferase involved in cell wall biosynthesis
MIEGQDIVCFSNDWNGDPLSKMHIIRRLAARNRILWVNSIGNRAPTACARDVKRALCKIRDHAGGCKQVHENIYVFSPLALPFYGNAIARGISRTYLGWSLRAACRRLGFREPITYTFLPTSADVAGTLGERLILYHCVDEFSEFRGADKSAILRMERRLIDKSDAVIVSSGVLYESKRPAQANIFLVTHGVDVAAFRNACDEKTIVPEEIRSLPRPIIGFYGLIAEWVDLGLIRFLAASRPQWSFVLIGKADVDLSPLRGFPNVHLPGRKDYRLLPAYCKGFDVAILPFVINELTLASNPLKLREYLAAGLPVVATPLPEAERLRGLVQLGRGGRQFLEQIESILAEGAAGPRLFRSRAMESESWDRKVEELSGIILSLRPRTAKYGLHAA